MNTGWILGRTTADALGDRSCGARRADRSGAAAVEFAIILPLLVTIVFGALDFGRFAYTYIAVTNAARAGAGFASFHHYTVTTQPVWVQQTTDTVLTELGDQFDASKVQVLPPTVSVDADGMRRVRVEVRYPFETVTSWPLIPNAVTLGRAAEMRFIR
jgi:Flp pilus assembly protein TadG